MSALPWFMRRFGRVSEAEWLTLAADFRGIPHQVEAMWSRHNLRDPAEWFVYPKGSTTLRDVQLFRAIATRAAARLDRPWWRRGGRGVLATDPVDRWLNVAAVLAAPGDDIRGTSTALGVRHASGAVDDVVQLSVVACNRLASGDMPSHYRGPMWWDHG